LATWLHTEPSFVINGGQDIKIPYSITIPANAEPGGYFAAIFWGEDNPAAKQGGEVSIGGKLGVLILLRVAGDIPEAAGIQDFGTANAQKFFSHLPILFTYRFKNDGGDRVVPLGDITIMNMFGSTVASLKANETEGSVLPNSIRKFSSVWGSMGKDATQKSFTEIVSEQAFDFHFGPYKAKVSLLYGAINKSTESTAWFLIVPWQLLLVCALVLAGLYTMLRVYTKWIIAKSKSQL
jgi:hypothetical protein